MEYGNYMVTKRKALSSVRGRPKATSRNGPVSKSLREDTKQALVSIICNYAGSYHPILNGYRPSLPHPTMKNGLNGLTRGGNGILTAHKESLLHYMKRHGKVKQESAMPTKKPKKRVSFGPSTVKIFSEMDYFSGEKAMLLEIARGQRIRDIKKSLRNNQKKGDSGPTVNGKRSSFQQARMQIKGQLPLKRKRRPVKKATSLQTPNHEVHNSSFVEKKKDAKQIGEEERKSSDKTHPTEQHLMPRYDKDDTRDAVSGKEVKTTKKLEEINGDGKDASKENMLAASESMSPYVKLRKLYAQCCDKVQEETAATTAKVCDPSVDSEEEVPRSHVGRPKGKKGKRFTVPRELRRLWIDFRETSASDERKGSSRDCARVCTNGLYSPLRVPAQRKDCLRQEQDNECDNSWTESRKRRHEDVRPCKESSSLPKKLCTSSNKSCTESLKTDFKECQYKNSIENKNCTALKTDLRECKDPKAKTPSFTKKKLQIPTSNSRNAESDVPQLVLRSSVRKLRPKPAQLRYKMCSRPLKPKSKPGKKRNAGRSGSSERKAEASKSSGDPSLGVALKRKVPKTSKLCTKAKRVKYKESLKEKMALKEKEVVNKGKKAVKENEAVKRTEVAKKEKEVMNKAKEVAKNKEVKKEKEVVNKGKKAVKENKVVKENEAVKRTEVAMKEKEVLKKAKEVAKKKKVESEKEVMKNKEVAKKEKEVMKNKEVKKEKEVVNKGKKAVKENEAVKRTEVAKKEKEVMKKAKEVESEKEVMKKKEKEVVKEKKVTKKEKEAVKEKEVTKKKKKVRKRKKKVAKEKKDVYKEKKEVAKEKKEVAKKEKEVAKKEKEVKKEKSAMKNEKEVVKKDKEVAKKEKEVAKEKKVAEDEKCVAKTTETKPNALMDAKMSVKKSPMKNPTPVKKSGEKNLKEVKNCVKKPAKKSPIQVKKCDTKPVKKNPKQVKKCVKKAPKKSPKQVKKCVKKPAKKSPKKVRKSQITVTRDKAKVEKILKAYVLAYKQGKKNLLYKLLKNGLHTKNNKKLLKNGLLLKDRTLLEKSLLSKGKKLPKK
ncbi:axoneme-associated protein mst101(2)-like isoform X1 [Palaemon carinicauda]|uniref:axoneme-associated protein mst101(2)-like isoform X1 n=1 Tax=Palaemon carinicauda TaxID=392227 RepID=UPI0035B5AE8F